MGYTKPRPMDTPIIYARQIGKDPLLSLFSFFQRENHPGTTPIYLDLEGKSNFLDYFQQIKYLETKENELKEEEW